MKTLISAFALGLMVLVSMLGCTKNVSSREADHIREILLKGITVGDSKTRVIEFFNRQGWDYTYDKWKKEYGTGLPVAKENGLTIHTVIVRVKMTNDDKVKNIVVRDAWKP